MRDINFTPFQELIYKRTYSRYLDKEGRRERWPETVKRYFDYMSGYVPDENKVDFEEIFSSAYLHDVMPSMRALWTAGKALDREHICGYNCAALIIDSQRAFAEMLYILMCGGGVGFSVERQFVAKLPAVPKEIEHSETEIVFADSKLGWAEGFNRFVNGLFNGVCYQCNLTKIRPKGKRLKVFGGRACLTGDTILYKDRKKSRGCNEITIKNLFDLERGQGKWEHKPNHFKLVKLRSLDEENGEFFRNNVIGVIDNGIAPVYEIITKNGYRIKATDNHRFMNEAGDYQFVSNFNVGDCIAVNGNVERKTGVCVDCGCAVSRRARWCKPCYDRKQHIDCGGCTGTTSRSSLRCQQFKKDLCEVCGHDGSVSELQIHHCDKNPLNNEFENLKTLCERCHRKEDTKIATFSDPYSHKYLSFDEIISIEYAGVERVYDLQMEGPNHNFIANGFVSHNSGPEPLRRLIEYTKFTFNNAAGRQLSSIECHDICCYIASIVVVGGVRRCLPLTAKVITESGIAEIGNIRAGDYIFTGGEKYKILDAGLSGVKKCLRLKHSFGEIKCSPDHRVAVFNNDDGKKYTFKHAKDISPGDCLVWDIAGFPGQTTKLPSVQCSGHFNARSLLTPEFTPDIAWLIGIIHGDGSIDERSVSLHAATHETSNLKKAKRAFWDFGVSGAISDGHGECKRLRVNSKDLADWFREHIKQSSSEIEIPEFIKNGKRDIRAAYLAGLFDADGRYRSDGVLEQFTTIYGGFCDDVVMLLAGLGIGCQVFEPKNKTAAGNPIFSVNIKGITNRISWKDFIYPFSASGKADNLNPKIGNGCDFKYRASMLGSPLGWKKGGYITVQSALKHGFISGDDIVKYVPVVVDEVLQDVAVEMCDIQVDKVAQFTTAGIVVHNSATISLSNLSDDRMRTAKNGEFWRTNPQRALANNAVCYTEKPEPDRFLEEWLNLMRSGSGERGIFNREGTKNFVKAKGRDHNHDFLINPCVPFNTRILTDGGYTKIGEVVGQEVNAWNGYEFSKTTPYRTGKKPIFKVDLSDGTSFFCTPNHEFILWDGYSQGGKEYRLKAEELGGGEKLAKFDLPIVKGGNDYFVDAYSQGFYSGDGNKNLAYSWLYETKYCCEGRLVGELKECGAESNRKTWKHGKMLDKNFVPINGTIKYCLNWLAGLCDADGAVTRDKNGNGIQISSINRGFLMDVKLMLSRMGVSTVVCGGRDAGNRSLPDGNGGNFEYYCKQDFRLLIGNMETKRLLDIGLKTERLSLHDGAPQRSAKRFVRVVSVEDTGRVEDVFCFTEPKNHSGTFEGIVTGQCGEVVLRPKQFCNLTEVVVRNHDTLKSLEKKVRDATIMGCIQSTLTDFGFLSADWKKNCEEERLLGVSLTGLRDNMVLAKVNDTAKEWLEHLNGVAHGVAEKWAKSLGVNAPAAICCVKPSGCRTGDSLLTTNSGIFCLDELEYGENAGDWVNVEGLSSTSGVITKTYNNGVSPVYSIDCNFGMRLKSTVNHKWMVHGKGWTRTDEIKEGDQLVYSFSEYAGLDQRLNIPDVSDLYCNCNFEVRLPGYMSTGLGWLLGYIWGNGSMSDDKSRFRFTDANRACLEKVNMVFSELFGISGNILNKSGEAAFTLEIASRKLWRFFEANGMVKNLKKLPLILRQSSRDSIIAFLAGMIDADGHAATKQVTFSTANDGLSEHFQNVALTLGLVFGRSKNVARKNSFSKKHMWLMTLSWGQSTENKIILKNNSVIMEDWVPPKLNPRSSAYRLCVVKSVAPYGSEQTYDVETSSHWFWAGAIMSHNTVSLLVDSASGMHPRFAKYYIRRVRVACADPLCSLLKDQGVPWRPENGETEEKHQTAVFEFPIKAPVGAVTTSQVSAIEQLEYWKMLKECWCDHNPSVTIYVGESEWVSVGGWVYENWNYVGGITFLPRDNQLYQLPPYETISESEYVRLAEEMPDIDYEALVNYENSDQTEGSREFACSGNSCELA